MILGWTLSVVAPTERVFGCNLDIAMLETGSGRKILSGSYFGTSIADTFAYFRNNSDIFSKRAKPIVSAPPNDRNHPQKMVPNRMFLTCNSLHGRPAGRMGQTWHFLVASVYCVIILMKNKYITIWRVKKVPTVHDQKQDGRCASKNNTKI